MGLSKVRTFLSHAMRYNEGVEVLALLYKVEMKTRANGTEGQVDHHSGTVDAQSVLNAIGQACLSFRVRTDAIVFLSVEVQEE